MAERCWADGCTAAPAVYIAFHCPTDLCPVGGRAPMCINHAHEVAERLVVPCCGRCGGAVPLVIDSHSVVKRWPRGV